MSWKRKVHLNSSKNLLNILIVSFVVIVVCFVFVEKQINSLTSTRKCPPKTKKVTVIRHKIDPVYAEKRKNRDRFPDIVEYIELVKNETFFNNYEPIVIMEKPYPNHTLTLGEISGRLKKYKLHIKNMTNLEQFHLYSISKNQTFRYDDPLVPLLLHDLATLPIINTKIKAGGTQLKLKMTFPNKIRAIFKPMRFSRDTRTWDNHFYFTDFERHHSEIAGFHLDRALGFRRTMPAVGRKVNVIDDIRKYASEELEETFFTSFSNRTCFYSNCMYHCNKFHPICADKDGMLEGSLVAFLPTFKHGKIKEYRSPWRRSYSAHYKADWEKDNGYCDGVKESNDFKNNRRLLDFVDLGVFDFIMGNSDRHSFGTFRYFGNETAPIIYDNGRGFGDPFKEDYTIIKPLTQCCIIRESTAQTLLQYQTGTIPLSIVMRESLATDPLSPILWEPYYEAMDRRVELLLREIRRCIESKRVRAAPVTSSPIKPPVSLETFLNENHYGRT